MCASLVVAQREQNNWRTSSREELQSCRCIVFAIPGTLLMKYGTTVCLRQRLRLPHPTQRSGAVEEKAAECELLRFVDVFHQCQCTSRRSQTVDWFATAAVTLDWEQCFLPTYHGFMKVHATSFADLLPRPCRKCWFSGA
eukprot:TRINITY_DN4613_c0_g1_i1.p1 TRINITY_DN4613_c0_g1~~TRINITY_DN4613_c0_g1_i1.p1  ORF type:complete len:140 (+),score=11.78 TRINITY_DN4613_c0_g1_i1:82-501(+)